MDLTKAQNRLKQKREAVSMTKDEVSSMYDRIELDELKEILSTVNWYVKHDETEHSEVSLMIKSFYGKTALAGLSDYKDHRNDSLEELKDKVLEQVENRTMQKGHYYDKDGNPFDGVLLEGQNGGWSAYCLFSENENLGYFEFMRS